MGAAFSLLRDVLDVVRAYELIESSHPDMLANVNALFHHESDMVMHNVENEIEFEIDNVVVTRYHHDPESEIVMIGARRDGQSNVLPLCAKCPAKTGCRER